MASSHLLDLVSGFADSLTAFRQALPERKSAFTVKALQEDLAPNFQFAAHDACGDVQALNEIISAADLSLSTIQHNSSSTASYQAVQDFRRSAKARLASFDTMVKGKAISKGMVQKAANSGLLFRH